MLAAAFLAGMILSFTLAWQGLFGSGLKVSKSKSISGKPAKIVGGLCALFGLALLGGVAWVVLEMMK